MSHVYDMDLQEIIRDTAKELSIDLKEGVYLQMPGPVSYTHLDVYKRQEPGGAYKIRFPAPQAYARIGGIP